MRICAKSWHTPPPDRERLAHRRVGFGGVQIIAEIGLDALRQRQRRRDAGRVGIEMRRGPVGDRRHFRQQRRGIEIMDRRAIREVVYSERRARQLGNGQMLAGQIELRVVDRRDEGRAHLERADRPGDLDPRQVERIGPGQRLAQAGLWLDDELAIEHGLSRPVDRPQAQVEMGHADRPGIIDADDMADAIFHVRAIMPAPLMPVSSCRRRAAHPRPWGRSAH